MFIQLLTGMVNMTRSVGGEDSGQVSSVPNYTDQESK